MSDKIDAFVTKLQAEGIEVGRQEAEKICQQARHQADDIVRQARVEAEKIIAVARTEAAATRERADTELRLAARDTVLRLRQVLSQALQAILAERVRNALSEKELLRLVIIELVRLYASTDAKGGTGLRVNLPPELHQQFVRWAADELAASAAAAGAAVSLRGTLKTMGLEYEAQGGKVEVTVESVTEALSELVGPDLRAVIDQAVAQDNS